MGIEKWYQTQQFKLRFVDELSMFTITVIYIYILRRFLKTKHFAFLIATIMRIVCIYREREDIHYIESSTTTSTVVVLIRFNCMEFIR